MLILGLIFLITLIVAATGRAAEDRPHMKRIDVSPARPDRGEWLDR
jgi:hypothetical protein